MNHTPGPWMAIKYKKQNVKELGFLILQNKRFDETNIATVFKAIDVSEEQLEANAKLIAAAPELLAALIHAFDFIKRTADWTGPDPDMIKIQSALAKATE